MRDFYRTILYALIFIPLLASGQNTYVPNWLLDSAIFEIKQGRQCSNVVTAQQNEIEKLGLELLATGTALRLSQKESINLDSLLTNSSEQRKVDRRQYELDKSEMKKKIKRRNKLIIGQLGVILIILLL